MVSCANELPIIMTESAIAKSNSFFMVATSLALLISLSPTTYSGARSNARLLSLSGKPQIAFRANPAYCKARLSSGPSSHAALARNAICSFPDSETERALLCALSEYVVGREK